MAAGQSAPARAALESILAREPDNTAAHLILGGLFAAEDCQRAATKHALAAARNPPTDPGLLGDLVEALLSVGVATRARELLDLPALAMNKSPQVLMRAASQCQRLGEHGKALALIERARALGAEGRDFRFYRAVQLAFNGNLDESGEELKRCIAVDPPLGRAFVQLARMRKQTAEANHLDEIYAAMQRVEPRSEDHAALEFARYKELEDLRRHDESWQALVHGNAIMHARLPNEADRGTWKFKRLIDVCTQEFLRAESVEPRDGPQPIFVVGMPRSGTTVLERILGNHSAVESAGELGDFHRSLSWATDHLASIMFDDITLDRLGDVDWHEVGERYLAHTQWRAHGKPFYVDKLPRNWMVAGLIHKALPHARILHLVRDPMDVCFSNWRAYFGPGAEYAYSYDLEALVEHYREYRCVMAHWHACMPGVVMDVPYTGLVREPESMAREILAFCKLEWEPGCVELARNTTPSATLSMQQVRQPIHARSFAEWQPYALQLSSLRNVLGGIP